MLGRLVGDEDVVDPLPRGVGRVGVRGCRPFDPVERFDHRRLVTVVEVAGDDRRRATVLGDEGGRPLGLVEPVVAWRRLR